VLAGGAGLSVALAIAAPSLARSPASSPPLLLIDETVTLPDRLAAFVADWRRLQPVSPLSLDASGYNALRRTMAEYSQIIGIGSGATLFCVERIAWDCGLRIAWRSQHGCNQAGDSAGIRELAAALDGACPAPTGQLAALATLQPAHGDGTLHIWTLMGRPGTSAERKVLV
jgi:hypothetical protein